MNKITWKIYAIYSYYARYRLSRMIPNMHQIISEYSVKSNTTGTKYPTLYKAAWVIMKNKPKYILESGTGTSTLILAELILLLQERDPSYSCKIISMESMRDWYELAVELMPEKYQGIVEIRLGEKEKYDYSIFRGYIHSNIPNLPYEFVLIDGPNFNDDNGSSTCMDAIKVRRMSNLETVYCVIDTRNTTVFMMQQIFGVASSRYFPTTRSCIVQMKKIRNAPRLDSTSFKFSFMGKLNLKSNSLVNHD